MPDRGEAGIFERWWQEHSELDRSVAAFERALQTSSASRASEALEELSDALRSHLAVEEDIYFPLLERLLPEESPGIRKACLAHRDLLSDLERIAEQIGSADLEGARDTLGGLLIRFRTHEREESRMVARLRKVPAA